MKHRILIESEVAQTGGIEAHLRRCITAALDAEGVSVPCEINVLITDDDGIRRINRDQRGIDAATDVLSFPMFELSPGVLPDEFDEDPATGMVPLGDMALSYEHICAQAKEYGHGIRREAGYLAVHSVLHLLGYDHLDEGPQKRQMRAREEAIMAQLDLTRRAPVVRHLTARPKNRPAPDTKGD